MTMETQPKPGNRPLGIALIVVGVFFLFLAFDLLQGNRDLNTPGTPLITGALPVSWRFTYGAFAIIASMLFVAGWIVLRGLRGNAYIALSPVVGSLLVLLIIPALVPTLVLAYTALIALGVVLPAGLAAWAEYLGRR